MVLLRWNWPLWSCCIVCKAWRSPEKLSSLKKEEECSLFLCSLTLKAADTAENPLFFKIKRPLHGTNIMTKNWQSMGKSASAHVRALRRAYACYSFFYKDWNNFCIKKNCQFHLYHTPCVKKRKLRLLSIRLSFVYLIGVCQISAYVPHSCWRLLLGNNLSCHTAKGLVSSAMRVNLFTFFPFLSLLPKYKIIYAGYNSKGVFYDILQI